MNVKEAQEEESPREEMVFGQNLPRGPAEPGVSKDHCLEYGLPGGHGCSGSTFLEPQL